jgi:hypothetical protein
MVRTSVLAVLVAACPILPACGSDEEPRIEADAAPPELPLAPLAIRRLLDRQYVNTIRDLLGTDAAALAEPPANLTAHGFDAIGAATLSLSPTDVRRYEDSARAIAEWARIDLGTLSPYLDCEPTGPSDEACMTAFVERFGRRAFRRPLTADEIDRFSALGTATAESMAGFYAGVEYVISAFLQSPSFLYQIELGEPDPDDPGRVRLTGYELAGRLSYFLVDSTPSEALLDAAETGALADPDGLRDAAREVLDRPEARAALSGFYDERFKLRDLATMSKDPETFPDFDVDLANAMRQEALALFGHIVWEEDADFRELFTARYAFVNADLAALYGVDPPDGDGYEMRELPASQGRAGILGQAGFLALHAHPVSTSPTKRGRFVAERLLCTDVPPPPPDVMPELPEDPGGPETMREKLARHITDEGCASCHSVMDGIGLGFEHFDAVGAWRADDRGMALDVTGVVPDLGPFDGVEELAELLAGSDKVNSCWVRNLYRHATGHEEYPGERVMLEDVEAGFAADGFKVRELLVELVASDAFRYAGVGEE